MVGKGENKEQCNGSENLKKLRATPVDIKCPINKEITKKQLLELSKSDMTAQSINIKYNELNTFILAEIRRAEQKVSTCKHSLKIVISLFFLQLLCSWFLYAIIIKCVEVNPAMIVLLISKVKIASTVYIIYSVFLICDVGN